MKVTRLIQTGEADPTNTTSAYYRGLALQALAAAPQALQHLVEDDYVAEVAGALTGTQGLLVLYLFAEGHRIHISWNPSRRSVYRYIVADTRNQNVRSNEYANALEASRAFRKLVDAMESK